DHDHVVAEADKMPVVECNNVSSVVGYKRAKWRNVIGQSCRPHRLICALLISPVECPFTIVVGLFLGASGRLISGLVLEVLRLALQQFWDDLDEVVLVR